MELSSRPSLRAGLGSRTGITVMAVIAAVLAAVLVIAALNSASKSEGAAAPVSAVVANQLIPKGSSGQVIAAQQLFRTRQIAHESLAVGAITDISQISGQVATRDIYPGQQLTAGDFQSAAGVLAADLSGVQRAIAVPIDGAHGMVGQVHSGDHVDVLAGLNGSGTGSSSSSVLIKVLARNVIVLRAPGDASTAGEAAPADSITLRVDDSTAARLAFATDNGKIWIVLRPGAGAESSSTDVVTLQSVLNRGASSGGPGR
jgi:Flp pilus assembly protein CpaB